MYYKLDNQQEGGLIAILSSIWAMIQMLIQYNLKNKISSYPCARI
jgi:hypothetical protein